ncbi:MAG: hypothetical protein KJ905_03520 [Nanoarchaeota archaeon]|nr:hypothetical protein [Nanoarchaeota archaeon]MBU1501812.1 hypothetical protein [Nanoarchaeota archaeon]MBU2459414.1 hypothetical protein [Nanoarchaeota archaeon]
MDFVFVVKDKSDRNLRLTRRQWTHITTKHPMLTSYLEKLKETLNDPDKIMPHEFGRLFDYYKYYKHQSGGAKFLKVVVKYLNGDGFILSAYFVKHIN